MVKIRRVLAVLIAALPITAVAGATHATASEPSYRNPDAVPAMYVGAEEGVRPNERYPAATAGL
jgi:hypothetical protein